MPWVYDPHSGGVKIPPENYWDINKEIDDYARTRPWYSKVKLKIRFKSQFCYIDTQADSDERPFQLCRLRNLNRGWSFALYTYSHERYEPCIFSNGEWTGSIHDILEICEPFIE